MSVYLCPGPCFPFLSGFSWLLMSWFIDWWNFWYTWAGILLWGALVLECSRTVQFCVKTCTYLQYFILSVCTSFRTCISFSLVLLCICFGPLSLWSIVWTWSVYFFRDLCLCFFFKLAFSSVYSTFWLSDLLSFFVFFFLNSFLLSSSCFTPRSPADTTV